MPCSRLYLNQLKIVFCWQEYIKYYLQEVPHLSLLHKPNLQSGLVVEINKFWQLRISKYLQKFSSENGSRSSLRNVMVCPEYWMIDRVPQFRNRNVVLVAELPTAAAQVRARVRWFRICGGQRGTAAGFLRVLLFPLPIFIPSLFHNLSSGAGTIRQ
jgi:hypothetical protein